MIEVTRDTTHPWSGAPGWDRMVIKTESVVRAVELSYAGRRKMWRLFWQDGPNVIMYKPAGAAEDWNDKDQWLGRDRDKSLDLDVGDVVYTNFSGQVTRHVIAERRPDFTAGNAPPGQLRKAQVSGSGVLIRVQPEVPSDGGWWLDPGWFRRVDFSSPSA